MYSDIPSWIQAGAAIVLTAVTAVTLRVLVGYAADTKTLAKNSADQIELSQMPFVALIELTDRNRTTNWVIQNIGFGPAKNVYHSRLRNPTLNMMSAAPPLGVNSQYAISNDDANIATSTDGFIIEYESLAGRKFRTVFTRHGDKQATKFERL
jgi:hypothetical protein